jgi:predicted nucleotidyltransferase component of viral defense system
MVWIHDATCFNEKYIREKAEENGFSEPLNVERFLWDCEIAAQLQSESDCFILKGGAAVQLHLPLEKQRGSIDIDIICAATKATIEKTVSNIEKKVADIKFESYTPKNPQTELNLLTYFVRTPALICSGEDYHRIKIDFLMEDIILPTEIIRNVKTFATDVKEIKCYSATSLIGDKLLALAENTIGVNVIDKLPKHLYDVYQISASLKLSKEQFVEIADAIKKLSVLEAKYRKLETTPEEAVQDVINTMNKYSALDLNNDNTDLKRQLEIFQGAYVRESQRQKMYGWCTRITQIRFLSKLIFDVITERLSPDEASRNYIAAIGFNNALGKIEGKEVNIMRQKLFALSKTEVPKVFNGKPLQRVFWHIVDRDNLPKLTELL